MTDLQQIEYDIYMEELIIPFTFEENKLIKEMLHSLAMEDLIN